MDAGVRIGLGLVVPLAELRFRASRAAGPGGQHVNTTDSRVELRWDLARSPSVTPEQRERLRARLGRRVNRDGELVMTCGLERSQRRNRELLLERFARVLAAALARPRARVATGPTAASRERRLRAKRNRAGRKRNRGRPDDGDGV